MREATPEHDEMPDERDDWAAGVERLNFWLKKLAGSRIYVGTCRPQCAKGSLARVKSTASPEEISGDR
jgi:hypothetical protein